MHEVRIDEVPAGRQFVVVAYDAVLQLTAFLRIASVIADLANESKSIAVSLLVKDFHGVEHIVAVLAELHASLKLTRVNFHFPFLII